MVVNSQTTAYTRTSHREKIIFIATKQWHAAVGSDPYIGLKRDPAQGRASIALIASASPEKVPLKASITGLATKIEE